MTELSRLVWITAGACLAAACGSSEPEPNTQYQAGAQMQQQPYPQQTAYPQQYPQQQYPQQQYPQQQYPQQQPQQQYPQQAGIPTVLPTSLPPLALPIPNAAAGSPAQQLDASAGSLALPILTQIAGTQAPGAKALGSAIVGNYQAGQQLESIITMQPGKCYTVIAAGLPPVSEVNIQLVATLPVPGMNPVLAQDQAAGAQAVLGQAPNCFKWALPLAGQVKVLTLVAAGQGIVATQVYEK
jgi:hypothetical protein